MNPQAKGWTPQRRARMAQQIKNWQPWQHSTGAKTAEGKARCSQNANKGRGALMAQIKELRRDNDRAKDGRIITHAQPEKP